MPIYQSKIVRIYHFNTEQLFKNLTCTVWVWMLSYNYLQYMHHEFDTRHLSITDVDLLQRAKQVSQKRHERQWDVHWNMDCTAFTYSSVLLATTTSTWREVNVVAHLPRHCSPLKKLRLLKCHSQKFLVGQEKPIHIIQIWKKYKWTRGFQKVIKYQKELKATCMLVYFYNTKILTNNLVKTIANAT